MIPEILIKVVGAVIIVALICFTIMEIFGVRGETVIQHVLLGLTSLLVGTYAITKRYNGK